MRLSIATACAVLPSALLAQTKNVDWPVFGGTSDNTHYSTLNQITPANVGRLKVAWTYETHDEFKGSEMQTNPVVIDGVLYGTSPKLRACSRSTRRPAKSCGASIRTSASLRRVASGIADSVVTGDRVLVTYRNKLYALDRKTGQPIPTFGDSGAVDMRAAFDRPAERITISASTPGVVYGDLYIIGSTVSESLPSSPGDIRAYDVKTGALRWVFHTIPRPGEFGYETWPADAWKVSGGANAWSGVTIDQRRGIVFAATGSAAFDFYGANRIGDDLFANTLLALDAKTGKRLWHFQAVRHDLWDWDFPAAPTSVVHRAARWPYHRRRGRTDHEDRLRLPLRACDGQAALPDRVSQSPGVDSGLASAPRRCSRIRFAPPPFKVRQTLTEDMLTTRTTAAHDSALKLFREYKTSGMYDPPNTRGTIIFPGVDGGAEWGGPAFDAASRDCCTSTPTRCRGITSSSSAATIPSTVRTARAVTVTT